MAANGNGADGAGGAGAGKPAGLSLSFSGIKAKARVSAAGPSDAKKRELITGIGASGVVAASGFAAAAGPRVIPKQEDSFKVGTGTRKQQQQQPRQPTRPKHFLPDHDDGTVGVVEDRFEVAPEAKVDTSISYGLTVHSRSDQGGTASSEQGGLQAGGLAAQQNGRGVENGTGPAAPNVTSREWENKAFKEGMEDLPEEADADAYAAMPIEEFGAAMLRGMGWTEGQGVGRRKAGPATPFQYVQRPHRLGLGAEPAAPEVTSKKHIKAGESREGKAHKVFLDAEGRQKHVITLDDKLVDAVKKGVHAGKTMYFLTGRHQGLACEVLALEPKVEGRSDRATVRLLASNATVTARCSELGEKYEADAAAAARAAEKAARKAQKAEKKSWESGRDSGAARDQSGDAAPSAKRHRSGQEDGHRSRAERSDSEDAAPADDGPPWLAHHIRVRIVDKALARGKLYLKKGTVVDVHQPTVCDVVVDDPRQRVSGVHQWQLETIVPKKEGDLLLILRGQHKGQRAKLLHRNAKAGAAAVQLLAEMEVVKISFDDIADYVGGDDD